MVLAEISLLFRGTTPVSYALLADDGGILQQRYKERMNMHVIPYDPHDDHVEVTNVLQTICDATKNGNGDAAS